VGARAGFDPTISTGHSVVDRGVTRPGHRRGIAARFDNKDNRALDVRTGMVLARVLLLPTW
jgi:hypothetical protein